MKIFISADIEGVTGVTSWDETIKEKIDFSPYARQMTNEVKSACEGANKAGAIEILVKDAHETGRNIDHNQLPTNTKLVRGWSGGIFSMVQELDETYDGLAFIGYHSGGSMDGNPLSHTMNTDILSVKLNGKLTNEFMLHAYIAAYYKVPVLLVSGDKALCEAVKEVNENIETVAVKEGKGNSTINIHPEVANKLIDEGMQKALEKKKEDLTLKLPNEFMMEVEYPTHTEALRNSSYPGAELIGARTLKYESEDFIEILRFMHFTV